MTFPCRVWRWRSQYGEVLGGLGTGIGDGDRGVTCGREEKCYGAKEREQETDCDAEDAQNDETNPWASPSSTSAKPVLMDADGNIWGGGPQDEQTPWEQLDVQNQQQQDGNQNRSLRPGYARHQVEGIGGRMTNKLVKMVRVGQCVPQWEDENRYHRIMAREVEGRARSWCGWCWRVIPGAKDLKGV
jgi:hypothetical protein